MTHQYSSSILTKICSSLSEILFWKQCSKFIQMWARQTPDIHKSDWNRSHSHYVYSDKWRLYRHEISWYWCPIHFRSWCKHLAQFCKRDGIPLPTRISSNESRMILGNFLFNRKTSESIEIHSLNFRVNSWFYEGSKTKSLCVLDVIDRNMVCLTAFSSETFRSRVVLDSDGFWQSPIDWD